MKKWLVLTLLMASFGVKAQTSSDSSISTERSRLEAAFAVEDSACYKKFLVNNCLDNVNVRRRETLADLRRQEVVLNDAARKAKAADQLQKIEDKSSAEKLLQEAEKRAQAVKDFEDRMVRDKQKNADREVLQAGEKAKLEAAAGRSKSNQDKAAGRAAKQTLEAEELRKYNERLEHAKERQARYARGKASQTKAPAQPLPTPQ
jgi:hypothetical protein